MSAIKVGTRFGKLAGLALAGSLALTGLGAVSAQAATPTVTFKGHVYSPTVKGVSGVVAQVYYRTASSGQYQSKSVRTSSTGRYEIKVPQSFGEANRYKFKVTDPGDNDRDTADGEWAPVLVDTFATSATTVKRNVTVHHGAKLSGRIYDRTGKPVAAGLKVYAQGYGQVNNPMTYTRAGGAYYFSNLKFGDVTLRADSPTTNGNSRYYKSTSSSGTLKDTEATALPLQYGQKTTGISIYFPAVSKITGRVTRDGFEPYGEGGNYVDTILYNSDGKALNEGYFTNPVFQFRDLPAGTYYLGFQSANGAEPIKAEFYADKATLAEAIPITVKSGGAVTGIVANLESAK